MRELTSAEKLAIRNGLFTASQYLRSHAKRLPPNTGTSLLLDANTYDQIRLLLKQQSITITNDPNVEKKVTAAHDTD